MKRGLVIRKIKTGDIRELADAYKEIYSEKPYNEKWDSTSAVKRIKNMLWMNPYVAVIDGKIAGFVAFYAYSWVGQKRGYIEELGVLKDYRGRGISKKLMKKAESDLKKKGVKEVQLDARIDAKAIKIYYKWGYQKTGIIKLKKRLK